jgi:hypothetical protein
LPAINDPHARNPVADALLPVENNPANCAGSDADATLQTVQGEPVAPCKPCTVTLQTLHRHPANCAGNPSNEPIKESRTSLRSVGARERATRISVDWQPSEADRDYAITHNVDPVRAADDMRNYWLSLPGQRACKLDWSRTFRNRVLALADQGRYRLSVANRPLDLNNSRTAAGQSIARDMARSDSARRNAALALEVLSHG